MASWDISWRNPKIQKSVWTALVLVLLAALGFALVSPTGTPIINLGSIAGLSVAFGGSFIGIGLAIIGYDMYNGRKIHWKDAIGAGLGGALALTLLGPTLGVVLSFSNVIGAAIGVLVLGGGEFVGIEVGDSF